MAHNQPHIQQLLEDRYYLRDTEGILTETTPEEMFARVAVAVAHAEPNGIDRLKYQKAFFNIMVDNKFLPNTPTLVNAGKERPGCFSACFTVPVEDSMEGIFDAIKHSALIMKAGGGVGFNFGRMREKGAVVKSTGHVSSGPISFMKVFDATCDTISQGGVRRGAMMGILPVWHPDIEEFIAMKDDGKSFSNFNISIGITDAFMQCVKEDSIWALYTPSDYYGTKTMLPNKTIRARDLWDKIVKHAHDNGDPGLIFLDTINNRHPLDDYVEATNPCGEIPLRPYESCNLGSINLMAYVDNYACNPNSTDEWFINYEELGKDIPTMVRFLDDIIEINPFPIPEIEKASKESRKIGLGVMGWADALLRMKIAYDSQKALDLAEELMTFIFANADVASRMLAEEKGPYPLWGTQRVLPPKRRNATLLAIAPTGTISRIMGVSSGIEPVFAWHIHHKLNDLEYDEEHWLLDDWKKSSEVVFPAYMKSANEIPWEWHLKMQSAFQKCVDNSISKTINLSNDAPVEDIAMIYWEAWNSGLKGITVYRDGSKDNQPLNKIVNPVDYVDEQAALNELKKMAEAEDKAGTPLVPFIPKDRNGFRKRGPVAVGPTHKIDTTKGKIYITVNYSEYHQEPVEVFIRLGHLATPQEQSYADYIGRLVSVMLKYNIPIDKIIKQGNKVYSDCLFWYNQRSFQSIPMLISYLLGFSFQEAMVMAEMDIDSMMDLDDGGYFEEEGPVGEYCYNCGSNSMIAEGGCHVCANCGFERCG